MAAVPASRHESHFPVGTHGVLVVVSASQDPLATARLVASLRACEGARIHVAAVRTPPTGYAGSFLRAVPVRALLEDLARASMEPLCRELDALGMSYRTHVCVGPWLTEIKRLVRELGCTHVALGANPRHLLRDVALRFDRWLIGTALRREAPGCQVVRGDEARLPADRNVRAGSAPLAP
jgi:hypothetical protein